MEADDTQTSTMQELLPFCRELLSQRPGRATLKIYLVGSALAALGSVLALADVACRAFGARDDGDEDDLEMRPPPLPVAAGERREKAGVKAEVKETEGMSAAAEHTGQNTKTQPQHAAVRTLATRQHAS